MAIRSPLAEKATLRTMRIGLRKLTRTTGRNEKAEEKASDDMVESLVEGLGGGGMGMLGNTRGHRFISPLAMP